MIALVDCNSFFCSVEQVFCPGLRGKPVCVLSANDGCVVALTPQAKAVGIRRGDPYFKIKELVQRHEVKIFSTNMPLYAAMSKRVNNVLRSRVQRVEQYSIDESFLYLEGYAQHYDLEDYMRHTALQVQCYTDIPVSIGVAPTKTLAKMGSKYAKLYQGYRGVCMIDTEDKRRKALARFHLEDVWGIGRATLARLHYYDIRTPLELADRGEGWIRRHLPQPARQTWYELNGIPCIDTDEVLQRQSICNSRSFGSMLTTLPQLRTAVAVFAKSGANRLRAQASLAMTVTVFVQSNRYRTDLPQYQQSFTTTLAVPSADTIELTQAALTTLAQIYRPGICYKKAGVILGHITSARTQQLPLFDTVVNRPARMRLMQGVDALNHRYGPDCVHLAVDHTAREDWSPRHEHRSGDYLTDIRSILTIQI